MATGPRGTVKAGRTATRAPAPATRARTTDAARTTDTARPPAAARPTAPGAAPSSTFVRAQAPAGPDVTERVRAIVGAVAPLLGLDPERIPITVRGGAGQPHGAARHDGVVFTGRFDPAMPPGRSLIVHELAHLRQHRNGVSAKGARAPDVTAAEAEAGGLAAAVRESRPLWVPQQVLPGGHTARDTGASGIAVDTTAPTADALERDLEALAAENHLDNVRVIADQLDPRRGAESKSTGENSLRALSALQFVVARALVRSLRSPIRLRLAGFQDEHHTKYPEACVAVLSALTADELRLLPAPADRAGGNGAAAALHGVDPGRLSTTARRALLETLRRLPVQAHDELEHGDRGVLFSRLLRTPPDPGTDAAELTAALRGEEELAERRQSGRATPARAPEVPPAGAKPKPAPAKPQPTVPGPGQPATGPEAGPEPEGVPGALPGAAPGVPRRAPRQVGLLMPPPPSTPAPEQRQRLTKVEHGAGAAAARGKKLPTAPDTVKAARGAVEEPPAETKARAGQKLAHALGAQPIPQLVKLADEIVCAVKKRRPPEIEDLTKSKANQAAEDAGHTITASVGKEATKVQGSYDSLSPNPAGQPVLKPTKIHPPGTQVTDPGIAAPSAAPDPIPAERLSLDADRDAVEAKAAQARMDRHSAEPLQGTPPFSDAAQGRADLAGLAATGAAGVAKQQAKAIDAAQADMADLQDRALEALTAARAGTVSDVHTGQRGMVGHEEKTRTAISAEALQDYNDARTGIEPLLSKLPGTALALWETGLTRLSAEFTQHLARVQGEIDERHSGAGGWLLGKWDRWTGLPSWVPKAYDAAEDAFGQGVRDLLLSIGLEVNSILANVEEIIQTARTKIDNLFRDLPDGLKKWADGERKRFGGQLDALSGQVADVRTTFVRDISQRAVSAVTDVQEKVEALRSEARGVIGRIVDAIEDFLDDPVKAIINGLLNLLNIPPKSFWALVDKIAAVIDQIADDPETFCNNLMAGVGQGFTLFFDHFPTHLLEGFWAWLTSGLSSVGVQLPTDFSPGSLFAFVLQLMGLTWTNIREILVRHIGEKNVELIEKAWQLISELIEKGPAGLVELLKDKIEPATIIDTIVNAAIDYVTGRLIKTVTIKVLELFNPVGAVLEAIKLIYRVLRWVFENAAKIFTLIETVVDGIADVLAGNVGKLALAVEKALAGLIPPVIDFLAGFLDLDDLPEEVAGVIKNLQTAVLAVADQVIGALAERAKGLLASLGLGEQPKPGGTAEPSAVGTSVRFTAGGESHRQWVEIHGDDAILLVASGRPLGVQEKLSEWEGKLGGFTDDKKRQDAAGLIAKARELLAKADTEAETRLAEIKQTSKPPEGDKGAAITPADSGLETRLEADQQELAGILRQLFELFGGGARVFEPIERIAHMAPPGQEPVTAVRRGQQLGLLVAGLPNDDSLIAVTKGALGKGKSKAGFELARAAGDSAASLAQRVATIRLLGSTGEIELSVFDDLSKSIGDVASRVGDLGMKLRVSSVFRAATVEPIREITITFPYDRSRNKKYNDLFREELSAQLQHQEAGLNRLTIDEWTSNRALYRPDETLLEMMDAHARQAVLGELRERATRALPVARTNRAQYQAAIDEIDAARAESRPPDRDILRVVTGRWGDEASWREIHAEGIRRLYERLKQEDQRWAAIAGSLERLAVLHNPDQVAGGPGEIPEIAPPPTDPADPRWPYYLDQLEAVVGASRVNSSIGALWRTNVNIVYTAVTSDENYPPMSWPIWQLNLRLSAAEKA